MANQYKRKLNKIDIKDDYAIIHTVSYGIPKEILIDLETELSKRGLLQ